MQYILSQSYDLIIFCTILVGKPIEPTKYPSKMKKRTFCDARILARVHQTFFASTLTHVFVENVWGIRARFLAR